MKYKLPMLAVVVCLQTVFLFSSCQSSTAKEAGVKNVPKETSGPTQESRDGVGEECSTSSPRSVTLAFTGDVLMGTNFPDSSYVTRDRGRSLFVDCADILCGADLAIGNLEGACYYGTAGEVKKKMTATSRCFVFRMPGDHARRLAEAGFDAMGVANNHAGDFGPTGRRLTVKNLRSVGVQVSGQKGLAEEVVMERHGVRYGYLAFAASCGNTLDVNDPVSRDSLIHRLRPHCDILVVSFHGGAEGTSACHVPRKKEIFLGENRGDVYRFAHECIDGGADIVVGHGPHVPRAMELYKGHLIAYSLGNFCAPFRMSTAGATGLAPLLQVQLDASTGHFQKGHIYSFRQVKGAGPRRDDTHAAAKNISTLTQQDFPQSGLVISEEGEVRVN